MSHNTDSYLEEFRKAHNFQELKTSLNSKFDEALKGSQMFRATK